MTYSLNSNYTNSSYQQTMGLGPNASLNIDKNKIREEAKNNNNIVTNTLDDHDNKEKVFVALAGVASWVALCFGMAKFNKSCRTVIKNGKPTSLLHKVQAGADKIGHAVENNKVGNKVISAFDTAKTWTKTHIVDKNKILSSIANTPANPQLSSPKSMLNGTLAETAQDAIEAINKYYTKTQGLEIEKAEEAIEKLVGLTPKMRQNQGSKETVDKLIEILTKLQKESNDAPIEVGPDKLFKKILERKVYPSELINKLNSLNGKSLIGETKDLSRLGKTAPKAFLRVVEGLTNGTAGGRIAIGMQAMCFGDAIVRTAKAPKGEKKSTFAESIINDLSFYLMMPVGLSMIYGAGGTKYIGMNKGQVAEYRKVLADLTEKVNANNISKADYKATVKKLKDMLKGDTKILKTDKAAVKFKKGITNIINKPVKALGKFYTTGLEQIPMYRGKDANIFIKANLFGRKCLSKTFDLLSHIPLIGGLFGGMKGKSTTIKGFGGGAMRFATYMFVLSPFLAKIMTKAGHLVFGKPTHSILDEDKEEKEKAKATDTKPANVDNKISVPQQQTLVQPIVQEQNAAEPFVRQNLLDKYRQQAAEKTSNGVNNAGQIQFGQKVTTEATDKKPEKDSNVYIPSTEPVVLDRTAEIDKYNKAMANSILYERIAKSKANQKIR